MILLNRVILGNGFAGTNARGTPGAAGMCSRCATALAAYAKFETSFEAG